MVPGHRINYSRWGLILQRTSIRPVASPRPAGWAHPFGDNPTDLLASAEQLLRRICVVGAPSRLFGEVAGCRAGLGGEYRCRRLTAARSASYWPSDALRHPAPRRNARNRSGDGTKLESAGRVGGPPMGSAVVAAGRYVGIGPDGRPAACRGGDRSQRSRRALAGHGPSDDHLLTEIADNLSRARHLIERDGRLPGGDRERTGRHPRYSRPGDAHVVCRAHGTAVASVGM